MRQSNNPDDNRRTFSEREPKHWQDQCELGIEFREKEGQGKSWNDWRCYYTGNFHSKKIIPINLIWSNGKIMIPKTYFRNPRVKVTPKKPDKWYASYVVESVDNYIIREIDFKYQIKAMIEDCYWAGTAFGLVGYDSQYGYFPEMEEVLGESTTQEIEKENKIEKIEYNINVQPGMPWFLRVPPDTVVVPWGALKAGSPEITDIPWIARRIIRRLQDVKDEKKYKHTKDLKASMEPEIESYKIKYTKDAADEYIGLWEIRDMKRGRILLIADNYDKFLVDEDDELQTEGFPFIRLIFNPHPRYFWGISDIKNLEPHQLALNNVNTLLNMHARMSIKKLLTSKGTLHPSEADKLLDENFSSLIETTGAGSLQEAIKELNFVIPQDLFNMKNEIRKDMRELVGYSRNEAGEFDQSTRRTATEATLVKQGSETRSSERRDIVADVVEKAIRKINQIIFERWDAPRVANIIGEDGVQYWVEYTSEDIKGEYDIQINAEEAQPIDTNKVTSDAIALLQQFAQDQDFSPEERKNIKRTLVAQFTHLGFDMEKALAPAEGQGMNPEQPIPFRQFAQGMDKGKIDEAKRGRKAQQQQRQDQVLGIAK